MSFFEQARFADSSLERLLEEAAEYYNQPPDVFVSIDKRVLKVAYRLSQGDWHRCVSDDGQSIVVLNYPAW